MILDISKHLDKNNLHHAYLIEGSRNLAMPAILNFVKSLGIEVVGNPDFSDIHVDSFKSEDARNLKSLASERGFSDKRVFVVSANSFLLRAQNALLKMFEEPTANTIFFLIVPDINDLLPTLISRFYLIKSKTELENEFMDAEKFAAMRLKNRIDFLKELLIEPEDKDEEGNEVISLNSTRSKALKFLNALEFVMHKKSLSKIPYNTDIGFFNQLFMVRKFLRQPGSSTKTLMESIALIVPVIPNS